jgi:hypothetical protein
MIRAFGAHGQNLTYEHNGNEAARLAQGTSGLPVATMTSGASAVLCYAG